MVVKPKMKTRGTQTAQIKSKKTKRPFAAAAAAFGEDPELDINSSPEQSPVRPIKDRKHADHAKTDLGSPSPTAKRNKPTLKGS